MTLLRFYPAFLALAVAAPVHAGFAVAQGRAEEAARANALKRCKASSIKGCEIQVWSCAK